MVRKRGQETAQRGLNPQALKRLALVSLLSQTGICTLSNATVGNWLAAGCPRNPDGTLSLVQVCAWLAGERRKKSEKPAGSAIEELRRKQAALAEFELRRRQREFYDRAEVLAMFEDAGARMRAVIEAVERNHGASVGRTLREALTKSFANIKEALRRGKRRRKPA